MNFIDPDSFVDPDQQPQGAWSEVYKKYLSEAQHRASRASIPGAEEYDKTPPMSFDAFSKEKDKQYKDRLIAYPETLLHMGLGMGSAVVGGLVAPLAPIMPWAHTRDPKKMFEDISALPSSIPKISDTTDDYLRSVGSVMQAFPATGTYPGLLRPMRAGQAATPAVAANLKALAEAKKKPSEAGPMPTEAPLPDTLANRVKAREQQAMTPSQLKEWKDTQDKFAAYQKEQEQLTRANQAQEAINARQAALEQDVATQTNQDFNAAERVRQEQAPTGYADWVEQQRQSANERQPGNNAPMEFESPYPADAQHYPDILQDAPYQHDNFIDPDTAGTKALPITVADTLNTGEKSVDPFQRTNTSRTVARNILETDLHPPIIKTVDARRGGKQSGAIDFQAIVALFPKFKGTKVTEPVYHGRTRGFRTGDFNTKRGFKGYYDETGGVDPTGYILPPNRAYPGDLGAWFSSTGKGTDTFAGARTGVSGGQVHQSYINLQSPKVFKTHGDFIDWFHSQTAKGESASKARRSLIKDGHDGIVIEESMTDGGGLRSDYVVFDSNNIKNAISPQMNSGMARGQRGALDFSGFNKAKQKLIEDATKAKIWAQELTGQQVVDEALAHGKDAKGATNFSAGGSLEAEKRTSPLVRGGVRILQRFKNQSENAIRESVFPAETSLRKLSRNELADLGEAFKQVMFLRERFSMEELAQAGLNERQLLAYKRTRDMFTDALEAQNKVREIQGLKPISENEAYLSSRWQGDFRMPFHDEKGRLKWYLAADSKRSLEKQASELMARFPGELTPGKMSIVKSSKKGVDAQSIYTQMLDVLGRDDPAVAKIAKWVEESTVEQGRKTLGQEKHFEPKANVQGFVGDRPWNNPKQEAIDMFQQQINYAKNAHNWTGMQLAGQELKHIFANEDLAKTQPHALNYLKEYYADNLGFNEHQVIKAFEDFVRSSGYSPNTIGRGIGNLKAVWVLQKLAVNTGFAISNVIQASNMLPHLADLTIKEGGNPLTGLALGIPTGLAMAAGHATQQPGKFHKALGAIPGYDVFTARAMKYAEDNSVIARSIYDESPIESSFSATGQGAKYLGKTITSPETVLRSVVYMTYVNALKGSKKFKNDVDIFRLAEEKTNISMGDYREGERAMVFNKMGNLGNALNTLQTYPMNFYNQWIWAGKETMRGNPVPAMVMLGAQTYMAGAMGIPGFAEADKLLEFIKDHLAQSAPTYWNKVKNFSLKKIMLDVGPDMLYGGASGRTGVALTARAAAPIPSEMVQTPGAPAMDLLQQGASVAQAVADPMDKQKVAQAVLNTAPTGLQGALETGPLRDQTSVQTGDTRTYGKIKDLSAMEGQVKRTPADERLRAWGLRSQREVAERDQTYATQKHIAQASQITRDLPGKIYNKLATNQLDDAKEYIELYTELSGKAPTRQQLETQIIARFTTPGQRLNMKKTMPLETVLAVKRLHETLDRMGYAD